MLEISRDMSELASKAHEGKLTPADMGTCPVLKMNAAMLERIRCGLVAVSNHNSLRAGTAVVITGPVLPWRRHLSVRCE